MNKTEKSSSQYVGVFRDKRNNNPNSKHKWKAQATAKNGNRLAVYVATEREAAIAVDRFKIVNGEEPRNILKRVRTI